MFCGWNLTEWWVILFPLLISHSTCNCRSSLVTNSLSWTHRLKVGGPENHGHQWHYSFLRIYLKERVYKTLMWKYYPNIVYLSKVWVFLRKTLFIKRLEQKKLVERHTWESFTERDWICSGMLLAFAATCWESHRYSTQGNRNETSGSVCGHAVPISRDKNFKSFK